jgi:hypothetical protein
VTAPAADPWPDARALAERLAAQAGSSVRVVLLYGSRLLETNPDRHSALDFVVVVDDYETFYRGLASAGELHRPVWLMTALARVLAPNVIAYAPDEGRRDGLAKCLVVSEPDLARALGPRPHDHFLLGRLVQRVGLVWAGGAPDGVRVLALLEGARRRILDWMTPYLEGPVDAAGLGRRLLEVCYGGEFRPESRGRAGRVFEAQEDHFSQALSPVLEAAVADGRMRRAGEAYVQTAPVADRERRRWRRHFRRSKARTTLRWFKHMVTFANWLPYVVRKVERHTGRDIELTLLERKLPLIFLWPRAIHVLVTRPEREIEE